MKPGFEPKTLLGEMGQVAEEMGEVLQHFGKILRFGIDHRFGGVESNRQAYYRELDDLFDCIMRIKKRHAKHPDEPLAPDPAMGYQQLAQAAQAYLVCRSEVGENGRGGVSARGKLRDAKTRLNALVGAALGGPVE